MPFIFKNITLIFVLLWTIQLDGQEPASLPAQQFETSTLEQRDFEKADWKKATEGIDYRHSTQGENKKDENGTGLDRIAPMKPENLGGEAGLFWNILVKIIFVSLLISIIGFFLHWIISGENIFKDKGNTSRSTSFDLAEVETNLADSNLDKFITQAEDAGNYSLAIRLHYLAIIKALSQKKIIRYKKNKTNHVYVAKVSTTPFGEEFRRATHAFERIWFGQNTFTKVDYQTIKPDFQQWISTAQSLNREKPSLKTNTP